MNAIRRHPLFSAWIACCLLLGGGGAYGWHHLRAELSRESAALARKTQERVQLTATATLSAEEAEENLTAQPAAEISVSTNEGPVLQPLDAYLKMVETREALQRMATERKVALAADQAFGFATYAQEGPPQSQLGEVLAQLALVRGLVEKLFTAGPDKLVAVRRESLPVGQNGAAAPVEASDLFMADPRLDPRAPALIAGRAVRLEFTGPTATARAFLKMLAASPEWLLVRSVEVEPLRESAKSTARKAKFTVVVVQAKPAWAEATEAGKIDEIVLATLWPAPDRRGSGDLFSPARHGRRAEPIVATEVTAGPVGTASALELLVVQPEPYRVQLAGYYGAPGNFTATLVSPGSPEVWQARAGQRLGALGVELREIAVKRIETSGAGGEKRSELAAVALLWDERQQELVILNSLERRLTGAHLAVLRLNPPPARPQEFRCGDTLQDGAASLRVEQIRSDPAEVVIVKEIPGRPSPEKITLTLKPGGK